MCGAIIRVSSAVRLGCPLALLILLAACATSVAPPTVIQGLTNEQKSTLRLKDVAGAPAQGVAMTPEDVTRIMSRVKAEIGAVLPAVMTPTAATDKPMNLKIIFTQYDEGSAFARFMLAGLGQIHLDGDVVVSDAQTGAAVARYQVSKVFSFGGLYGGTTTMQDVEKGFAKSVADALKPKT